MTTGRQATGVGQSLHDRACEARRSRLPKVEGRSDFGQLLSAAGESGGWAAETRLALGMPECQLLYTSCTHHHGKQRTETGNSGKLFVLVTGEKTGI